MMSSQFLRASLWPVVHLCRNHTITRTVASKSSLCFPSQILCALNPHLPFTSRRTGNYTEIFRVHSDASSVPSVNRPGVSDLDLSNSSEPLFVELNRVSATAVAEQNKEDVNRRISVRINDSESQMKAVELYKAIYKMKADEILSLIENCFQQLDKTHLCICIKRLCKLSRASKYHSDLDDFSQSLQYDSRFQALCILVAQKAQFLEPSIAYDMVTFMAYFGIDSLHPVMKHMLQLAKHFVSDLALDQLVVFANCLSEMSSTDQTKVLIEAVRLLCVTRSHQLGMLTTWHRVTLLGICGDKLPYFDQLLKEIWRDRETLNLANSVKLLVTFSLFPGRHRALEIWCLRVIEIGLDVLNADDATTVVRSCQRLDVCPSALFQDLSQMKMSFEHQIRVWLALADCGWFSEHLTDAVMNGVNAECLEQLDLPFPIVVKMLSCLGHMDKTIRSTDYLQSWVQENSEKIQCLLSPAELLDFCISLLLLGLQLNKSLEDLIFSMEFLQKCLEISPVPEHGMTSVDKFILINDLSNKFTPEDSFMAHLREMNARLPRENSQLHGAINYLWPFARHGQYTSSGLYADHVLKFDSKSRTAVLVFPKSSFWDNTMQLKSFSKLYAKRIQRDGFDVVVINDDQWEKLIDRERFEFLKCRISEAPDNKDLIMW